MIKFKNLLTLILGGVMCASCAFGFAACGSSEEDGDNASTGGNTGDTGNTGDAGDTGESSSDIVDAAGWVAAMTSSILNSSFTGTETYTSETSSSICTVIGMVDLVADGDIVTGKTYYLEKITDDSTDTVTNYLSYDLIEETQYKSYTLYDGSESCRIAKQSENGFAMNNISIINGFYMQIYFADESYFGGEYFNYDDEAGAYVWEYTSGSYTYCYVIKINNGSVSYLKGIQSRSGDNESEDIIEVYYTYGGVSVTIPDDIQSKFDALTIE